MEIGAKTKAKGGNSTPRWTPFFAPRCNTLVRMVGTQLFELLSLHSVEGEGETEPSTTDEDLQRCMEQIHVLEDKMNSAGAWVFGGALHGPDTATVVRRSNDEVPTTDGPFVKWRE